MTISYAHAHIQKKATPEGAAIIHKIFIIYLCLIQTYFISTLPQLEQNAKERYKTKKTKKTYESGVSEIPSDDEIENDNQINYTAIVKKHFYKKIGQNQNHILEWIKLFEATLCFDAWVSQSSFAKNELESANG